MNRAPKILAGALALSLLTAACGDDTEKTTTAPAASAVTSTMATSGATKMVDIVDTAAANSEFSTLVAAVKAAGLVDTLKGPGPFTVFAPTDKAFAALLKTLGVTAEQLLADTKLLKSVLTYHVVPSKVLAADVVGLDGKKVTTVNGAAFTVGVKGKAVTLTDANGGMANVTATDIAATNGVIHVIDAVILPPKG